MYNIDIEAQVTVGAITETERNTKEKTTTKVSLDTGTRKNTDNNTIRIPNQTVKNQN